MVSKIGALINSRIARDNPIDHAMVKSINDNCHVMGIKTIAEFVENDAIREQLSEIGVDYAQGYRIGKPESFSDLIAQLDNVKVISADWLGHEPAN